MANRKKQRSESVWEMVNRPLIVALISIGLLGGIGKVYTDWQASAADVEVRRAIYVELLAEYQHRVSLLIDADGDLNTYIGEGVTFKGGKKIPDCGPVREEWERFSTAVGQKEQEILRGQDTYVPTTSEFRGVDFLTLAARIEQIGGVPDIQLGALRLIRTLDWPPELLWLNVRSYLPMMMEFGVRRHMLYTNGQLPLPRGATLTERQEAVLGFPNVKPGDLDRAMAETDRKHSELQKALDESNFIQCP